MTKKALTCGVLCTLLALTSLCVVSCEKVEKKNYTVSLPANSSAVSEIFPKVTQSSSTSSEKEEDIKTSENEKIYSRLVYNYYDESVGEKSSGKEAVKPYKCSAFDGTITKDNAEVILRYTIDNSFSFKELDKYSIENSDGSHNLIFPKETIENYIMKNINCKKVDSSLFKSYNQKNNRYVVLASDFGGCGEIFGTPKINSITKYGDKITVKADFYAPLVFDSGNMAEDDYGLFLPDTSKKYQSCVFTYKKSGSNNLLLKVQVD